MKPVLILGEEPRIVVNIARSLSRRGVPVDVGTFSSDAPALNSRAIRQCVAFPDLCHDAAFAYAVLLHHLESQPYDLLIPASDTALALLSEHHAQLSERLQVACPPSDIAQRVLNKDKTLRSARECGVPTPRSVNVSTIDALDEIRSALMFPVIAKPLGKGHHLAASFKVRRFDNYEELRSAFALDPKFGRQNLIQEYCPGEGVGVEVLMENGRALALFQHRRLKELPRTGGVSVVARAEPLDPLLADYAVRLLQTLEWDGVAMVEFRVHAPSGRVVLMEVNGRYWGSLQLSIMAGIDFPWYQWQLAHGQSPNVPSHYQIGLTARWTNGALQRLTSREEHSSRPATVWMFIRESMGFLRECLPPTRDLLWSVKDPGPGLSEAVVFARRAVRHTVKRLLLPMIPASLLSLRRRSRVLDTRARRVFLSLAMARGVGLKRPRRPQHLRNVQSVLFICHGNILRSPMAAALCRKIVQSRGLTIEVHSAGLHANPLNGADRRGLAAAAEFGVSLADHRAEPITWEMVQRAGAIFVMDQYNEAELLARYPSARSKLFYLGACRPGTCAHVDIDDPYTGELADVQQCYRLIQSCLDQLMGSRTLNSGRTRGETIGARPTSDSDPAVQQMRTQAQHIRL